MQIPADWIQTLVGCLNYEAIILSSVPRQLFTFTKKIAVVRNVVVVIWSA